MLQSVVYNCGARGHSERRRSSRPFRRGSLKPATFADVLIELRRRREGLAFPPAFLYNRAVP